MKRNLAVILQLFLSSARLQKKRATLTIASLAWGTVTILLLLETLLITGLGGAFGFAIAFAVCGIFPKFGVGEYVGNPDLSLSVAALTAAILGLTGLIAGYFPARDASRLDPVVAMKL